MNYWLTQEGKDEATIAGLCVRGDPDSRAEFIDIAQVALPVYIGEIQRLTGELEGLKKMHTELEARYGELRYRMDGLEK